MEWVTTILAVFLGWTLSEISSWNQSKRESSVNQKRRIDSLGVKLFELSLDSFSWAKKAFRSNEVDLDDDQRLTQLIGRVYHRRAIAIRLKSEIKSPPIATKLFRRLTGYATDADAQRLEYLELYSERLAATLLAIQSTMSKRDCGSVAPVYVEHETLFEMTSSLERFQGSMARYLASDDQDVDQAITDATSQLGIGTAGKYEY